METEIAGIKFPNPFGNASGVCCTTLDDLVKLKETGAGGIWTKTQTIEPREGNPHPRVFCIGKEGQNYLSGNCVGLANGGCTEMNQIVQNLNATQPVILSIGGPDPFDIVQMVERSKDNPAIAGIEINPSCPNLEGEDMLAFNFDGLLELLQYIKMTGITKPIGLKLPYYQNPSHFKRIANIIKEVSPLVRFVTCINGMPGLLFDPDTNDTRTRANDGITGMGGDILLPFALGNISRFYKVFKEMNLNVDIIGCGGATCPEAAWQMIWAGAKFVQIGTRLLAEFRQPESNISPSMAQLWNEFVLKLYEIMDKHGFTNISDACGGFHTMDHVLSNENVDLKEDDASVPKVTISPVVQIHDNYANALAMKSTDLIIEDFPPRGRSRNRNKRIIPERRRYQEDMDRIEDVTDSSTSNLGDYDLSLL